MIYLEAFSKVLPVILLFVLGAFLRKTRFLDESTVGGLKKLVVNITLPAALFLAMAGVNLEARHLAIVGLVFAGCALVLLISRLIGRPLGLPSPYFPTLMTGFEAGMMGYAVFGAVYGAVNIYNFAVVDLGHVIFVFFVLVPFVQRLSTGAISFGQTLVGFLKDAGDHRDLPRDSLQPPGPRADLARLAAQRCCSSYAGAAQGRDDASHRAGDRL